LVVPKGNSHSTAVIISCSKKKFTNIKLCFELYSKRGMFIIFRLVKNKDLMISFLLKKEQFIREGLLSVYFGWFVAYKQHENKPDGDVYY
jgi:hypothetical protein